LHKNDKSYLKASWGEVRLDEMQRHLDYDLYKLLKIALELNLQYIETEHMEQVRRQWTKEEELFLRAFSKQLSIQEAANLLHRSRYATYQRVRFLGLHEMINKRS